MDRCICDTNIWVALFDTKDTQHEKAKQLMQELIDGVQYLYITNYIDLECIAVLIRKVGFHKTEEWIQFRSNSNNIHFLHMDEEDHKSMTHTFLKLQNIHLSFVDISLVHLARNGFTIKTFDKKLQKALQRS